MASRYTISSSKTQKIQSSESLIKGNKTLGRSESESEADGNGSTETLSAEEQHTLRHTQRQDPQGEEQTSCNSTLITVPTSHISLSDTSSHLSSIAQNDCNSSISSNTNTLIIHHSIPDELWGNKWLPSYSTPNSGRNSRERSVQPVSSMQTTFVTRIASRPSETVTPSSSAFGTTILNTSLSSSTRPSTGLSTQNNSGYVKNSAAYFAERQTTTSGPSSKYMTTTEITDIPSSYLDQSEVLKHLISKDSKDSSSNFGNYGRNFDKNRIEQSISIPNSINTSIQNESSMVNISTIHREDSDIEALLKRLPAPPAYSNWQTNINTSYNLKEHIPEPSNRLPEKNILSKSQPDLTRVGATKDHYQQGDKHKLSPRLSGILQVYKEENVDSLRERMDYLTHENHNLKLDLDIYYRKVSKLQKIEIEMTKVGEQHEALVKLCERREQLERLARHKLHSEVQRLTEINNDLKEQNNIFTNQIIIQPIGPEGNSEYASFKRELSKRDLVIAQLISQNKELIAAKETLIIEKSAQQKTLNEQRAHIDVLDTALTNSQTSILKLEEEVRQKQNVVEQVGQLKRLLLSMKHATDRREQSEKNLRQKLEMEILQLNSCTKMDCYTSELHDLRRELREKEERIMMLESEVIKWEQRFLQESAIRHFASDSTSLISRAQSLEAQYADKDAKIRNFQKQSEEKDLSYDQTILSNSSMGISSKLDNNTYQTMGLSHGYNYSPSISASSSTSSQLNVPPYPIPKRDEELGKRSITPSIHPQYTNIDSSDGSFLFEHNRSGSYCCYVNADDADENIPEPEMIRLRKVSSGGNLVERPDFHTTEEKFMLKPLTECQNYPFPNYYDQNLNTKQTLKHAQCDVPSLSKSSLKISAPTYQINSKASAASQYNSSQLIFPYSLQANTSFNQSHQTKLFPSQHFGMNQQELPSGDNKDCLSSRTSNDISIEILSRGEPPPYYSQHQVYTSNLNPQVNNQNSIQSPLSSPTLPCQSQVSSSSIVPSIPVPKSDNSILMSSPFPPTITVCQRPHPPNVFCRICQNVRRSHRQNAAALVRRANSSGCQHNRRSAPSPASSSDSLDDAPSILERLKKEWELGILGGPPAPKSAKANCKVDRSKTLPPHALGLKSLANFSTAAIQHKEEIKKNLLDDGKCSAKAKEERNKQDSKEVLSHTRSGTPNNTSNEIDVKKDVAHLDRALNRLSIKRNSGICAPRYSLKSFANDEQGSLLLESSDVKNLNETINKQSIVLDNGNFSEFTNSPGVPDSNSPNQILKVNVSTIERENIRNFEKNCNDIELIILEDSDLKVKSDNIDLRSDIQDAT